MQKHSSRQKNRSKPEKEERQRGIRNVKGKDLVATLLERNREQSALFTSSDAALWRGKYRAEHPTEMAGFKCMDGRLHLPELTETPTGIIQPFRNLGGQFNLGWPFLNAVVWEWVQYAISRGRLVLPLVTYHFSRGSKHRGCKGFNYDTAAAVAYTRNLREQFERVLGFGHSVVYPVQVGIETDEDALIFHGLKEGNELDLASLEPDVSPDSLRRSLEGLYPGMQAQFVTDLLPLMVGNLRHIAKVRAAHRPPAVIDHQEQVLAVGRGFDWLHWPNKALIVGPWSPDLSHPIEIAAKLLLSNINEGRVPSSDGVVLMSSAVYRRKAGPEIRFAEEKSRVLAELALGVIREEVPELMGHIKVLTGITDLNTREFTPLQIN